MYNPSTALDCPASPDLATVINHQHLLRLPSAAKENLSIILEALAPTCPPEV